MGKVEHFGLQHPGLLSLSLLKENKIACRKSPIMQQSRIELFEKNGRAKCGDVQTPIASRTHQAKITFAPNSDHFVFCGGEEKIYNFCGAMVKIMR